MSLDSRAPRLNYWDLSELFKSWGIASEFLHFVGAQQWTNDSDEWMIKAITRIEDEINPIWERITGTIGVGLFNPKEMTEIVRTIWEDYLSEKIDDEAIRIRLYLVKPISAKQKMFLQTR